MSSDIVYVAPRDPVQYRPGATRSARGGSNLKDDREGSHVREIELKRSRGEISCAECRRLKIKCDRQLPCSSCVRRGCASLCPNGSLATGQGTRFVLAATDHLHRRMGKMSERIRQLEDALAIMQSSVSQEPHPLLRDELLSLKVDKLDKAESDIVHDLPKGLDGLGTLSITEKGERFFGASGGPELLFLKDEDEERFSSPRSGDGSPKSQPPSSSHASSSSPQLQPDVALFSSAFPFTPVGTSPRETQEKIRSHLPPWSDAIRRCETYLDKAGWLFHSVTRDQLMDEMLPAIYRRFDAGHGNPSDYDTPHALALLFTIFAVGVLVDLKQEPYSAEADHFYQLARAAIGLQNIFEQPSLVSIQSLHLMSVFLGMREPEGETDASMEMSWSLIRTCMQLSLTIGLHRDSARWGLGSREVEKRRVLFWDLFTADAWQSLSTGRPPCITLPYVDCHFPRDDEARLDEKGQTEPGFGLWTLRFTLECVADTAAKTLTANIPSYATVLDLDARIRDFNIPKFPEDLLDEPSKRPAAVMARFIQSHARETILLYLHRSFFAQALIDDPVNPLRSQYAPSFLATYRSASHILKSIREEFEIIPTFAARFWMPWTFAFSSAVVFGTIVVRGPSSSYAPSSLQELDKACELFTTAGQRSRKAAKASGILQKLKTKAHVAYESCLRSRSMPDLRGGGDMVAKHEKGDELDLFSGRVRIMSAKGSTSTMGSSPSATEGATDHTPSPPPYSNCGPSTTNGCGLRLSEMENPLAPLANAVGAGLQMHSSLSAMRSPDSQSSDSVFSTSGTWLGSNGSSGNSGYKDMYTDQDAPGSFHSTGSGYPSTVKLDEWVSPSNPRTSPAYSHSSNPDIGMDGMEYGHGSTGVAPQQPFVLHSSHSPIPPPLSHSSSSRTLHSRLPPHDPDPRYPHGAYPVPSSGGHLGGTYQHSPGSGGTPPELYATAPRELSEIGLASQHSGMNQRWTTFMQDSGLFYGPVL